MGMQSSAVRPSPTFLCTQPQEFFPAALSHHLYPYEQPPFSRRKKVARKTPARQKHTPLGPVSPRRPVQGFPAGSSMVPSSSDAGTTGPSQHPPRGAPITPELFWIV
jgi:hypothetical protein